MLAHSKDATFFSNMTGASNPGQIIVKVLVKVVSKVGKGGHKMFTLHNINTSTLLSRDDAKHAI